MRDAPGAPSDYFSSLSFPFTCGLMDTDAITFCSDTVFNLTSISNYNESCVVGMDGCRDVSCQYGNLSRDDCKSLCADDYCQYGLVNCILSGTLET